MQKKQAISTIKRTSRDWESNAWQCIVLGRPLWNGPVVADRQLRGRVNWRPRCSLDATVARLLIDMAVPLALLPVLKETGNGHNKNNIDALKRVSGRTFDGGF